MLTDNHERAARVGGLIQSQYTFYGRFITGDLIDLKEGDFCMIIVLEPSTYSLKSRPSKDSVLTAAWALWDLTILTPKETILSFTLSEGSFSSHFMVLDRAPVALLL